MSDNQSHRMEALEWWRQLTRLEQLEIVGKYSNGKDFEFIATSSLQIQRLYIVATAEKTDAIEENKRRIENREQLREQRKKELEELIKKDNPKMKLYTEEDLRDFIDRNGCIVESDLDEKQLTPIEIPSNEQIIKHIDYLISCRQNIIDNADNMPQHLLEGGCMAFESAIDNARELFLGDNK
jgi:hypothetical protein